MKSRTVDYITNNEDSVRMRIFDGDLPADEATVELLRTEKVQRAAEWTKHVAFVRQCETEANAISRELARAGNMVGPGNSKLFAIRAIVDEVLALRAHLPQKDDEKFPSLDRRLDKM